MRESRWRSAKTNNIYFKFKEYLMARDRIICVFADYVDTRQNSNKNGIQYHEKSKNGET